MKVIEVNAKKLFVRSRIPGAKWVINQYVGCGHACLYCYAKSICRWKNYGEWGSWVEVKKNAPELARRYVDGWVAMSTVSDPYQPIEEKLKLTRKVLENMNKKVNLSILTKSDLVLRDIDLFKKFERIEVGLTINDEPVKENFEPVAPDNERRIEALRELKEEGIRTYGFIGPAIPKMTNVRRLVRKTRKFVDFYWIELLNLKASGREFVKKFREGFPASYEVLRDERKLVEFVREIKKGVRGVKVRGIILHSKI
ncbi:MAG TPA: radical SAM protein [Candidatus Aenigmarchaeota archaeon]|nr:radical SAM protein [Candidatus Aenigmarchaeota archaeon]